MGCFADAARPDRGAVRRADGALSRADGHRAGRALAFAGRGRQADGILVVDTCSWSQLEPAAEFLRTSALPRVIVDHHQTRDELKGAGRAAAGDYLIDPTAAAACVLVFEWARAMNWLNEEARAIADALYVGISTDTGWFRFSNTDARTFAVVAELVRMGVQPDAWYSTIYETVTPARIRLEAAMLAATELSDDGRIAWSTLTAADFETTRARPTDTEDLIHGLQRLAGVCVALLFTQDGDGRVRVNLRSKPPYICGVDVDVAAIARSLGGGGHERAAGVRLAEPLPDAQARVLAAVRDALGAG